MDLHEIQRKLVENATGIYSGSESCHLLTDQEIARLREECPFTHYLYLERMNVSPILNPSRREMVAFLVSLYEDNYIQIQGYFQEQEDERKPPTRFLEAHLRSFNKHFVDLDFDGAPRQAIQRKLEQLPGVLKYKKLWYAVAANSPHPFGLPQNRVIEPETNALAELKEQATTRLTAILTGTTPTKDSDETIAEIRQSTRRPLANVAIRNSRQSKEKTSALRTEGRLETPSISCLRDYLAHCDKKYHGERSPITVLYLLTLVTGIKGLGLTRELSIGSSSSENEIEIATESLQLSYNVMQGSTPAGRFVIGLPKSWAKALLNTPAPNSSALTKSARSYSQRYPGHTPSLSGAKSLATSNITRFFNSTTAAAILTGSFTNDTSANAAYEGVNGEEIHSDLTRYLNYLTSRQILTKQESKEILAGIERDRFYGPKVANIAAPHVEDVLKTTHNLIDSLAQNKLTADLVGAINTHQYRIYWALASQLRLRDVGDTTSLKLVGKEIIELRQKDSAAAQEEYRSRVSPQLYKLLECQHSLLLALKTLKVKCTDWANLRPFQVIKRGNRYGIENVSGVEFTRWAAQQGIDIKEGNHYRKQLATNCPNHLKRIVIPELLHHSSILGTATSMASSAILPRLDYEIEEFLNDNFDQPVHCVRLTRPSKPHQTKP